MKLYYKPDEEYNVIGLRSFSPKSLYYPLVPQSMFFYKMYHKYDKSRRDFDIMQASERYLTTNTEILKRVGKTFFCHSSYIDLDNVNMGTVGRTIILYFHILDTSIKNGRGYYKIRSKHLNPPLGKKYIVYASDGINTYSFSVV